MNWTSLTTLPIAIALLACGGRQHVHPACLDDYDACINTCAYQCEQGELSIGSSDDWDGDHVNTWNAQCEQCTSRCDDIADSCGERAERRLPDD